MADDLPINDRFLIPAADLSYQYSRSGGAGGQHVNTSETRVQLRFAMSTNTTIHPAAKARIREAHPSLLDANGDVLIAADRHRSRKQNVDDARRRLVDIVRRNLFPPKPRRATKPSKGAKKRRLDGKTRRGAIKRNRGRVRRDD